MEGTRVLRYRRPRWFYWTYWGLVGVQLLASGLWVAMGQRLRDTKREIDREMASIEARIRAKGKAVPPDPQAPEMERLWAQLQSRLGAEAVACVALAGFAAMWAVREHQRERNGGVTIGPEGLGVLDHRGRTRSVAWRDIQGGWHLHVSERNRTGPGMSLRARGGRRLVVCYGLEGWQELVKALCENCGLHQVRNWLGIVRYVKRA